MLLLLKGSFHVLLNYFFVRLTLLTRSALLLGDLSHDMCAELTTVSSEHALSSYFIVNLVVVNELYVVVATVG
jgi:hypothetical protein